jgi:hypothetical protein
MQQPEKPEMIKQYQEMIENTFAGTPTQKRPR